MAKSFNGVLKKIDNLHHLEKQIKALTAKRILVGFPADEAPRTEEDPAFPNPITNAALGYIHNYGAPEAGIPQREFMEPGIRNAEPVTTPMFKKLGQAALKGADQSKIDKGLTAIGIIAAESIKMKIMDGPFLPLARSTLEGRTNATVNEALLLKRESGHSVPSDLHSDLTGTRPLNDSGQMRNAVTSVLRDAKDVHDANHQP
jgi:hypothetical protein